jgi:DNA topoisomerase-1
VTVDLAVKLLSLPRDLGPHPDDGEPVIATQGRFGPFIKHGSDSRSIGPEYQLLEITLEQALSILAQPKAAQGRGRGVAAPPLKTFDASPVTSKPIELRDGRYGLYVTDGETNASLPKDMSGDELSFEQAVSLLQARAAAGPSKKKSGRGSKKSAPSAKKTASKKTTSKKTTGDEDALGDDADVKTPAKKVAKKVAKKAGTKASKGSTKTSKKTT